MAKIIKFEPKQEFEDKFDIHEVEDIEYENELIENRKFNELIKIREKWVKKQPDNLQAVADLGKAYFLSGEYEKTIEYLKDWHYKFSDIPDFKYLIYKALKAEGKSEDDFTWKERPTILNIEKAKDICFEILKGKRGWKKWIDVHMEVMFEGYNDFKEEALFESLKKDERFEIQIDEDLFFSSKIKLKKQNPQ